MKHSISTYIKVLLLGGGCAVAGNALASVPYVDYHHKVKQPDGSTLELVINGTTHYADQRTIDGFPVVFDSQLKGYAFARLDKTGARFVSTGILVNGQNAATLDPSLKVADLSRSAKLAIGEQNAIKLDGVSKKHSEHQASLLATPDNLTGTVKGLTVLIQFPDLPANISQQSVDDFANKLDYTGYGNAHSIRGYFRAVSANKLDYTNTVTAYYTAKHEKAYYTDPDVSYGVRAQALIREALEGVNTEQNIDFSTLTTNKYNKVMGLNIFYAGDTDGGWAQGLWPHKANLQVSYCADGVCASGYQISNMSDELSIGTFVHESGHLIANWPDLYDYDGGSYGSAAAHCSMGYGILGDEFSKSPMPPNGYFRHLVGWENVAELNPLVEANAPGGQLSLQANSNDLYRWSNPAKDGEAFYLEARNKTGLSQHAPDEGLIVWHVDKSGSNNKEWHPLVQMEHADGARDPENKNNKGDENDLYDASYQSGFGYDLPNGLAQKGTNSRWWNGADSGFALSDISAVNPQMSFTVNAADPNDIQSTALNHGEVTLVPNSLTGQTRYFTINAPQGIEGVTVSLAGNNGDTSLYIKQGAAADENDHDCKSTTPGNSNETCTVRSGAGIYYVAVVAQNGFNNLTVNATLHFSDAQEGDRFVGSLSDQSEVDIHPDGSWFRTTGGNIRAILNAGQNTKFKMRLEQWRNMSWVTQSHSQGSETQQQINYDASNGYYRIKIYSYQGSGNYVFDLIK